MVKSVKLGVLMVAVMLCSVQHTSAQVNNTGTTQTQTTQRRAPARQWGQTITPRAVAPEEYKAINLEREVALPSLPAYPGKQVFVHGLQYPSAVGGTGYMIVYNTEHPRKEVKDWWTTALKGEPWKVEHASGDTIKAKTKEGYKCTITATNPLPTPDKAKMKGMRGGYTVYFQAKATATN